MFALRYCPQIQLRNNCQVPFFQSDHETITAPTCARNSTQCIRAAFCEFLMEHNGTGMGASGCHYDFHSDTRSVMIERFMFNLKHRWVERKIEHVGPGNGSFRPWTLPVKHNNYGMFVQPVPWARPLNVNNHLVLTAASCPPAHAQCYVSYARHSIDTRMLTRGRQALRVAACSSLSITHTQTHRPGTTTLYFLQPPPAPEGQFHIKL
jgi:hypothetical protein